MSVRTYQRVLLSKIKNNTKVALRAGRDEREYTVKFLPGTRKKRLMTLAGRVRFYTNAMHVFIAG